MGNPCHPYLESTIVLSDNFFILLSDMDKIENSYLEYLKIFIDANKQWKLKKVMDFDHDLPIISEYITDWESKLQVPLGIPANKVKDIKAVGRYNPTQPVLERLVSF